MVQDRKCWKKANLRRAVHEFNLGHGEFDLYLRHESKDFESAVGHRVWNQSHWHRDLIEIVNVDKIAQGKENKVKRECGGLCGELFHGWAKNDRPAKRKQS